MRLHLAVILLSTCIGLLASAPALAAKPGQCEVLFNQGSLEPGKTIFDRIQKKDFAAYWNETVSKVKVSLLELEQFREAAPTAESKKKLKDDSEKIESWLLAHFFFDRIELAASPNRENMSLTKLWDRPDSASPFLPFKKTFKALLLPAPSAGQPAQAAANVQLSVESISQIHRWMMDGKPAWDDVKTGDVSLLNFVGARGFFNWTHVEGIGEEHLGRVRSTAVGFNRTPAKNGLPHFHNPFLTAVRVNPALDRILYASLGGAEKFVHLLSAGVREQVQKAKEAKTLNDTNAELTTVVLTDLLKTAIAEHAVKVASAKTLDERVTAHAEFTWKFISIHPFLNGNGRTARAVLARLLMSEGLLPPLLKNQNDVTNTSSDFVQEVKDGILLTDLFMNDVLWRAENHWEITESPVVLSARLPERIYFDSEQASLGKQYANVDVYDFAQFLREHEDAWKLKKHTETEMLQMYVEHLQRWTAFRAKTREQYQVRFVPEEMHVSVFNIDAENRERWFRKKRLFYSSDLAWRGLSLQTPKTLQDLLGIFVNPDEILLSMNSAGESTGNGQIHESVESDFKKFNQAILKPKEFFQAVNDHMKAEGSYGESFFLSAAMNRSVADRFSRGFLTNRETILGQKGQLIVAGLTPQFGTAYFNRLNPIAQHNEIDFVSKYPRQQEIAIAGMMAPDSVMRIEYRNVNIKTVAENTGELIAGETEDLGSLIFERSPLEPSIITVTESDGHGEVLSIRRFQLKADAFIELPGGAVRL